MVKVIVEEGEYERALVFDNPELAKELEALRNKMAEIWGETNDHLVNVREGDDGTWLAVFRSAE